MKSGASTAHIADVAGRRGRLSAKLRRYVRWGSFNLDSLHFSNMRISLSDQQVLQLRQWLADTSRADIDSAPSPSGVRLVLDVALPFGAFASAFHAEAALELGEVMV